MWAALFQSKISLSFLLDKFECCSTYNLDAFTFGTVHLYWNWDNSRHFMAAAGKTSCVCQCMWISCSHSGGTGKSQGLVVNRWHCNGNICRHLLDMLFCVNELWYSTCNLVGHNKNISHVVSSCWIICSFGMYFWQSQLFVSLSDVIASWISL